VGLLLALAACTDGPRPSHGPTPGGTVRPTPTVAGVRGCDTSAEVLTAVDPNAAVGVGPVRMQALEYRFGGPGLLNLPADSQGWWAFKIPMIIVGDERVTVTIPDEFRDIARLTYVPGRGDYATTFVPCDSRPQTQFAGGIAIRRPVCLPLMISWSGHTELLSLAFGEGACPPR
jgi:hypothetical protein